LVKEHFCPGQNFQGQAWDGQDKGKPECSPTESLKKIFFFWSIKKNCDCFVSFFSRSFFSCTLKEDKSLFQEWKKSRKKICLFSGAPRFERKKTGQIFF